MLRAPSCADRGDAALAASVLVAPKARASAGRARKKSAAANVPQPAQSQQLPATAAAAVVGKRRTTTTTSRKRAPRKGGGCLVQVVGTSTPAPAPPSPPSSSPSDAVSGSPSPSQPATSAAAKSATHGRRHVSITPADNPAIPLQKRLPGGMGKLAQLAIICRTPTFAFMAGPTDDKCHLYVSDELSAAANDPIIIERLLFHSKRARHGLSEAAAASQPATRSSPYDGFLYEDAQVTKLLQMRIDGAVQYGSYVTCDTETIRERATQLCSFEKSLESVVADEPEALAAFIEQFSAAQQQQQTTTTTDVVLHSGDYAPEHVAGSSSSAHCHNGDSFAYTAELLLPAPVLPVFPDIVWSTTTATEHRCSSVCPHCTDDPALLCCDEATLHELAIFYYVWH